MKGGGTCLDRTKVGACRARINAPVAAAVRQAGRKGPAPRVRIAQTFDPTRA